MVESPTVQRSCRRCTEFLSAFALAAVFFGLQFTASVRQGVLSVPPTYDDNTYLLDAAERLQRLYDGGTGALVESLLVDLPHSPLATLQDVLGLAMFGWSNRSPVLLNAIFLLALTTVLRWRMAREERWPFVALAIACLSWPIASFLTIDLRPDAVCALLTSLGVAGLFWRPWSEAEAGPARWSGICFGLALLAKPTIFPLTVGVLLVGWACAIGCDRLERGTSLRELATGAGSARFLAYAVSIPFFFLLLSWRYFYRYIVEVMLGEQSAIWTTVDVPSPRILFYLTARGGGRETMGGWLWVALAVAALAVVLSLRLRRSLPWFRISGFATTWFAALVAVTLPKELIFVNGLIVAGLIYVGSTLAAVWCFEVLKSASHPRASRLALGLSLVGLSVYLFHFHLYYVRDGANQIESASVSQRRWRLLEDVGLRLERAEGSPPLVLFTTVTPYLNPQTLGFDRLARQRTRLKMIEFHRDSGRARTEAALERADAVVSFAPGSRELMGWVPSDRHLERLNEVIETDSRWSVERLDAPNGERGAILVATRTGPKGGALRDGKLTDWSRPRDATTALPVASPLVSRDVDLGEDVALREIWLTTPWPIEQWPASGRSFTWLGPAADGALRFRFWAARPMIVAARLEAIAGPSRLDPARHLKVRGPTGAPQVVQFAGRGVVHFRLLAESGVNTVEISCSDAPDVQSLRNGDSRRLLVGIAGIVLSRNRSANAALQVFR